MFPKRFRNNMSINSILSSAIACLIFFSSAAQSQVGKNIDDHLLIKSAHRNIHGEGEKETIGSPYLNEKFVPGNVYTFNAKFVNLPMRYNIFDDYLEFEQNNQTYILDPEPRIKKVTFDNKTFVVLKYNNRDKSKLGYLQLLDSGRVMLFAKKNVLYRESQAPKALEASSTPAKYTNVADVYFYKIGNSDMVKIESIKQMTESFQDQKDALAQFIKKEKISAKKEEDLIKLIKYYNSL